MKIVNTLEQHLQHKEISPQKYVRSCHKELAEVISSRHKIYLDTRFWLLFRDVILGRKQDESLVQLLNLIRSAVKSGRAICPISQDSFSEIFLQNDPKTLKATAELVEELSASTCLTEFFGRLDAEIWHFMVQKTKGDDAVCDLSQLVWTKCGYVLGYVFPKHPEMSQDYNDALEKAFFDQMWATTFIDMHEHLGPQTDWKVDPTSVDGMNVGKFANDDCFKSFKQLFMIELAGALDGLNETLTSIMHRMHLTEFGDSAGSNVRPDPKTGKMAASVIYQALKLNKLKNELPTLRTHVTLHAALRWDKKRKYKPNDLADLRHAAMALPYCDTFLTEGPLCSLIHEKHLKLTDSFSCRTFSKPHLALKHLLELGV